MLVTNNSTPLYEQLKNIIKNDIMDNVYSPGERMPSEAELGKRYDVSRITVRRAIHELETEGMLRCKQGKGTFVIHQKHKTPMDEIVGFTDSMKRMKRKTSRIILAKEIQFADDEISNPLQLKQGAPVIRLKRIMLDDDQPLLLDECYFPVELFPGMFEEIQENVSTYALLREKYHQSFAHAYKEFNVEVASIEVAQYLNCAPGDPLFSIFKILYNDKRLPIQISKALVLASRSTYVLESDLNGSSTLHIADKRKEGPVNLRKEI